MSTLYLVATPIGNLNDITLRALEVLGSVELVAAEDTRRSRILLQKHGISTRLVSYHEHNKDARIPQLLKALSNGDLALISDAGTPVISDPGYALVSRAVEEGHRVVPIPGPSAPIAALAASGMPSDRFTFLGYLPRRHAERVQLLETYRLRRETLLLFEVPHRLLESLDDLCEVFGNDRRAAVCRELTKLHEDIQRGTLKALSAYYREDVPHGEITLVVEGATRGSDRWTRHEVQQALKDRLEAGMSRSAAARDVAGLSGWRRQELYKMSLEEA